MSHGEAYELLTASKEHTDSKIGTLSPRSMSATRYLHGCAGRSENLIPTEKTISPKAIKSLRWAQKSSKVMVRTIVRP